MTGVHELASLRLSGVMGVSEILGDSSTNEMFKSPSGSLVFVKNTDCRDGKRGETGIEGHD